MQYYLPGLLEEWLIMDLKVLDFFLQNKYHFFAGTNLNFEYGELLNLLPNLPLSCNYFSYSYSALPGSLGRSLSLDI